MTTSDIVGAVITIGHVTECEHIMRRFLQIIIKGYGWRLGALAAVATVAALGKVFA